MKYSQKAPTYNFQYLYLFENNDVRENIHFYSSADNFLSKCIISLFNIAKSKIEFFKIEVTVFYIVAKYENKQ